MDEIFVGMPVYNGARFISKAIDSLREQTFTHWSLLISDNASEDETAEICKKYCLMDSRIKYHRHEKNIGAPSNFKYLLDKANSKYFMWAAADDLWRPDFISSCVKMLDKNENIGMAFSNIVNIDSFGRVIRTYPPFEKYAGKSSFGLVYNYTINSEILGKANLIYSIYRLKLCKDAWSTSPLSDDWGSDMSFVLAAISRSGLCIDKRVLFQKRIVRDSDSQEFVSKIIINHPNMHIFPFTESFNYIKNNSMAVYGTKYFFVVLVVMLIQMPQAFVIQCINFTIKMLKYCWNYNYK